MLVAEVRLSVNLTNHTIDEVLSKLQRSHLQLLDLALDDLRFANAPSAALWRLEVARSEAVARDRLWFNQTSNFVTATISARDAQRDVFRALTQEPTWASDMHASGAELIDVVARMFAVAQMCARAGRQSEACCLLRLARTPT